MLAICECSSTQLNVSSQNSRLLQAEQREYSQLQSSCFGGSLVFIAGAWNVYAIHEIVIKHAS